MQEMPRKFQDHNQWVMTIPTSKFWGLTFLVGTYIDDWVVMFVQFFCCCVFSDGCRLIQKFLMNCETLSRYVHSLFTKFHFIISYFYRACLSYYVWLSYYGR
uniref:Uncharacterized protein n=1 Tax=Cacopsylla melanoneura TaxID=428564 RepID=A0A8D8SE59_9HEMI